MSLRIDELAAGRLWGRICTFEACGDTLPWHRHGEADAHITIVARGRVRMETGPGSGAVTETYDLAEGHCIDTPAGIYHQFVALTDNARIFNIAKEPKEPTA